MRFPLWGSENTSLPTSGKQYNVPTANFTSGWGSTQNQRQQVFGASHLTDWAIRLSGAPGSGKSYIFTIMKNGTETAAEITIADTDTEGSWQGDVTIAEGDLISVEVEAVNTPTAPSNQDWTFYLETADGTFFIIGSSNTTSPTSGTNYAPIDGGIGSSWATTVTDFEIPVPTDLTLKKLLVASPDGSPGSGKSYALSVRKNNTSDLGTATISDTNQSANSGALTDDLVPGDTLVIKDVPSGTPTARRLTWCLVMLPDTDGESVRGFGSPATPSTTANNYEQIHGNGNNGWNSSENVRYTKPDAITIKKLYGKLVTAPGAAASGKTRTFTLMDNGSPTALTITFTETETTKSDTTHSVTTSGGGNPVTWRSSVANTPAAATGGVHLGYVVDTTQPAAGTDVNDERGARLTGIDDAATSERGAKIRGKKDIYVATTGNDTTGNGDVGTPYATIQKALDIATPGCNIIIRAGTYTENVHTVRSGLAIAPITIKPYAGETVLVQHVHTGAGTTIYGWYINHDYIIINGLGGTLTLDEGHDTINVQDGDHNQFKNFTIQDSYTEGIRLKGTSSYNIMDNLTITNTGNGGGNGEGIYVGTGGGTDDCNFNEIRNCDISVATDGGIDLKENCHDNIVEDNEIYNTAGAGSGQIDDRGFDNIIRRNIVRDSSTGAGIYPGDGTVVYRNRIYGNAGNGIKISVGASPLIYNNTVYGNGDSGLETTSTAGTAIDVRNNIFQDNTGEEIYEVNSNQLATFDYNFVYKTTPAALFYRNTVQYSSNADYTTATGRNGNGSDSDPELNNPASDDFTTGNVAPVVDAGVAIAPYTDGYEGSAPDIGWYETTLGTADDDERGAHLVGQATTNSERSATIRGKTTANSERSGHLVGQTVANAERGGHTVGQATTNAERSAHLIGGVDQNSERGSKTHGTATAASERTGHMHGAGQITSERQAKTTGTAQANAERGAKTQGQVLTNAERSGHLIGTATANAERGGHVVGGVDQNSERSATIQGKATTNAERGGHTVGTLTTNSERSGHLVGVAGANEERGGKLTGTADTNSERAVRLTGQQFTNSERSGHLVGTATANSERNVRLTGGIDVASERSGHTVGKDTANNERGAKIHGKVLTASERSAIIEGTQSVDSERGGHTVGQATTNAERSVTLTGTATANSERGAKTHGKLATSAERGGHLVGHDFANSERTGKITGTLDTESERNVKIQGQQLTNAERGSHLIGTDTAFSQRTGKATGTLDTAAEIMAHLYGQVLTNDERGGRTWGTAVISSERSAKITGKITRSRPTILGGHTIPTPL